MIYHRHDPPPPPKPRKAPLSLPASKATVYTREVIRKAVEAQIANLHRPDVPERPEPEIQVILDWLEQSGTLDQWNCSAACERLAKSLLHS